MKYFDNIFAAFYRFYNRFRGETPLTTSIILVVICQISMLLLILAIFKKVSDLNYNSIFHNKLLFIPIFFIWFYLIYRYYSKEKVKIVLQNFQNKTSKEKRIWAIVAIISFVGPIISIATLSKK